MHVTLEPKARNRFHITAKEGSTVILRKEYPFSLNGKGSIKNMSKNTSDILRQKVSSKMSTMANSFRSAMKTVR